MRFGSKRIEVASFKRAKMSENGYTILEELIGHNPLVKRELGFVLRCFGATLLRLVCANNPSSVPLVQVSITCRFYLIPTVPLVRTDL